MKNIEIQKSVCLKKGRDSTFKKKHHWVFSGAVKQLQNNPTDGDLVWILGTSGKKIGYGFYGDKSIALRVLSFDPLISPLNQVNSLLYTAYKKREKLGLTNSCHTNAYRLFHSEGDMLPGLTIDIFNDIIVVQLHHTGISLFIESITEFLLKYFPETKTIALKHGKSKEERDNIELIHGSDIETIIKENSISFIVNIMSGQKTGFFLDQRNNRELVGSLAQNKSVLNLFSFTGGFSLYAIANNANRVVSVDSSKQAIEDAQRNYNINNLKGNHEFITKDCEAFLTQSSENFDIVICDPPALVKNKKDFNSGLKQYAHLQKLALSRLKDDGTFLTFSCSQFVRDKDLKQAIDKSLEELNRTSVSSSILRQAKCHTYNYNHPESLYLKGYMIKF